MEPQQPTTPNNQNINQNPPVSSANVSSQSQQTPPVSNVKSETTPASSPVSSMPAPEAKKTLFSNKVLVISIVVVVALLIAGGLYMFLTSQK